MSPPVFLHATVVVVGEHGLIIEGASGSGKSTLAEALLLEAPRQGLFARLVGDDRVGLSAAHGRLVARPHPALAGVMERRGTGLVGVPHLPAAVLRWAVRLAGPAEPIARLPEAPPARVLLGVTLPLLLLRAGDGPASHAIRTLAMLTLGKPVASNNSKELAIPVGIREIAARGGTTWASVKTKMGESCR